MAVELDPALSVKVRVLVSEEGPAWVASKSFEEAEMVFDRGARHRKAARGEGRTFRL